MSYGRKALAPYLSILLGVAILMTLLFLPLFGTIYDKDPQACEFVDYRITQPCKEQSRVGFVIRNNANIELKFIINRDTNNIKTVPPQESLPVKVITDALDVEILPVISDGLEVNACNAKAFSVDGGLLINTCQ